MLRLLCCLALAALACESDREAKAEAGQLSHAIDVLRNADNSAKAPALGELQRLPCARPETCSVQSACIAAYELHLRALDGIAESKRLAASQEDGAALPALVRSAQESLERAKGLAQKCTDAQGELVRRYGLR